PFVIPNTSSCHSEHSEESRGEKEEIHRFALNDKRPNAEEHPPSPPSKGGRAEAKRWGKSNIPVGRAVSLT
ncbi:hypothetical protein, partial [Tannerella forsythia]|uniref:hypothetical protein n=1 Tax=Tannerella forsythia TaxID=28112 RepID=UPI0028E50D1A